MKINDDFELIKEYSKIRINYRKEIKNYEYKVNYGEELETDIFRISKDGNYKCEIGAYISDFPLTIRNYLPFYLPIFLGPD